MVYCGISWYVMVQSSGGTLHPVIATIRDDYDQIRTLLYSYDTHLQGRGATLDTYIARQGNSWFPILPDSRTI